MHLKNLKQSPQSDPSRPASLAGRVGGVHTGTRLTRFFRVKWSRSRVGKG